MEIESVALEEMHLQKALSPKNTGLTNCLFYKTEACSPTKMKFKICAKCHRCQVITMENAIPRIFDKIVGVAIFMMATFGIPGGGKGGAASGGTGGAGGGGGH
ncbi:MAG TPA: hypothetical protein VMD02_03030 [Candidatus Omnitrophota bacterium]|nr:hypothetical protein [Candidatus Omnitrophota bacterium]